MVKFVHVTDIHIMGRNPVYRKDEFLQTVKKKIKWVNDYAKDIGAKAILCTGDIFDRADTPYSVFNEVVNIFASSQVPWLTIIGNHDEFGYNPETIARTAMGALIESGAVKCIDDESFAKFSVESEHGDFTISIVGKHSTDKTDNREDKWVDYGYDCRPPGSDLVIHMCHGYLVDGHLSDIIAHTEISEIIDKIDADIVLTGHEHVGFGVVNAKGKMFINPGALTRTTSGVGDVNRESQIAEITVFPETRQFTGKIVKVGCAKPAEEVIDIEKAMEEKEKKKQMELFVSNLGEENDNLQQSEELIEIQRINPRSYIDSLTEAMYATSGVSKEYFQDVGNLAKSYLDKAEELI